MRHVFVASALLAFCSLQTPLMRSPVDAALFDSRGKTRAEFRALWQTRLDGYAKENDDLDKLRMQAVDAFKTSPFEFAPGDERYATFFQATLRYGRIGGRGKLLEEFLARTKGKPSTGILRAWLQGQIDTGRQNGERAQASEAEVKAMIQRPNVRVFDIILQSETAALQLGQAQGHQEELGLIIENFLAYADQMAEADAKDAEMRRRVGLALGAMGRAMQANQGWTATCTRAGAVVNCSGR